MRWNMVLGALVVSVGLSSQSFGFELLDRMLGLGCGCEARAPKACCEKPVETPACGCEKKSCGCRDRCSRDWGSQLSGLFACRDRCAKPKCGCKAKAKPCCKPKPKPCCKPKPKCCKPAPKPCCKPKPKPCCKPKPKCGCKTSCRSGSGLLDIFQRSCGCREKRSCGCRAKKSCGCGSDHGGHDEGADEDADSMPPPPDPDTSASL